MGNATDWLARHEIWFKTIAAVTLTIVSIVIAFLQMRNTSLQASNTGLQAQLAEAQALPIFEIKIQQELNQATQKFDNNILTIDCVEGRVFEFEAEIAFFLQISKYTDTFPIRKLSADIPVSGFYFFTAVSAATRGRLITAYAADNNRRFIELDKQTTGDKLGTNLGRSTYVHLKYTDLLGRRQSQYVEVYTVLGVRRMKDEEAERLFAEWRRGPHPDFFQITPEEILKRLSEAQ